MLGVVSLPLTNTTTSEAAMSLRLKIRKDGKSHGRIKMVPVNDIFGRQDHWVADTKTSKVFKHLDGMTELEVKAWLVHNGYRYTLVYS